MLPTGESFWSAFGGGMFVVMWNYLGWDSLSTIAEEVDEPSKTFPKALLIGIPLVTLSYLVPAAVGIVAMPDLSAWSEGVWPEVARRIAGPWLGWLIAGAGVISAAGLFYHFARGVPHPVRAGRGRHVAPRPYSATSEVRDAVGGDSGECGVLHDLLVLELR
jgi:amino acid transporter